MSLPLVEGPPPARPCVLLAIAVVAAVILIIAAWRLFAKRGPSTETKETLP
jgi:hypothetical protein